MTYIRHVFIFRVNGVKSSPEAEIAHISEHAGKPRGTDVGADNGDGFGVGHSIQSRANFRRPALDFSFRLFLTADAASSSSRTTRASTAFTLPSGATIRGLMSTSFISGCSIPTGTPHQHLDVNCSCRPSARRENHPAARMLLRFSSFYPPDPLMGQCER